MEDYPKTLDRLFNHESRISRLEECVVAITNSVREIKANSITSKRLILYVILPLIILVGILITGKLPTPWGWL